MANHLDEKQFTKSLTNMVVGNPDDCSTWPGLSRLLVPQSDILDWSTVIYQGPGKIIIHPSSLYYRPFHVLISSNKDSSVLRIQRFEYRSPASVLSLGLLGSKDIEPKDSHPVSIWYIAGTQETAKTMLILDICQTIRNGGVKRAQRQHAISRTASPLTPAGIMPLQNHFQIEFSVALSGGSLEKITLQVCDEETDQGCSKLLERLGRHLRSRQLPLYPHCTEWVLLQDTIAKVHCRLIYSTPVCRMAGVTYMQPDGHYEEMIIATAPDLAKRLIGCPNPHLCVLAYRKEKIICIQLFHTVQSQVQCHEQPDKKFPKHEIWIGTDKAFPAFIRMLRIYQVIDGGGNAVEYSKRISIFSAEKFLRECQLPANHDRVFVLPFGQGAKLEFGFVQFSGDTVAYGKYASEIGGIFQEICAASGATALTRDARNRPPVVADISMETTAQRAEKVTVAKEYLPEVRISIPEHLEEEHVVRKSVSEPERWAWLAPQHSFRGTTDDQLRVSTSAAALSNQPTIC